ncbi:MAG: hypothetical protein A3D63_02000 [Candidatus Wildermuthbacteria bacterium RIFCSPHIGHO2_02_FULL_49_17]|nr:MAG: hypothetical protein A3D63_02000 [Candidatus Wildermuthbacteria bacterium RIFCSPHIGHO2_02_FULL_49_17]
MKKALFIITLLAAGLFFFAPFAQTQENTPGEEKTPIYLFEDRLCPVCKSTKEFIQSIQKDYPHLELHIYPISDTAKLREIAERYGVKEYTVMAPTIFVGDPTGSKTGNFLQFSDFTSKQEEMIVGTIKGEIVKDDSSILRIPYLNAEIDISDWSLPLITVVLGSLDGLNICSAGALIFVLSIVLVFDSKRKIFLYGGLYIVTAAAVYGTLVFGWGKLFEALVGHLEILRTVVGLSALGGGIYFFKEFLRFLKYGPTCQFSESAVVKKATNRLEKAFGQSGKGTFFLVSSVMFFAAVIIIIELPCSIGIPIVFTGMLAESGVSLLAYTLYILAYLFFFMLIEICIFTGAVLTKRIWIAKSQTLTWITLAGALVLFYLAFSYLFF